MSIIFILITEGPNFAAISKLRRASALYAFILENFWTKVGLKVLLKIPSI